jgi:hypothetical protein
MSGHTRPWTHHHHQGQPVVRNLGQVFRQPPPPPTPPTWTAPATTRSPLGHPQAGTVHVGPHAPQQRLQAKEASFTRTRTKSARSRFQQTGHQQETAGDQRPYMVTSALDPSGYHSFYFHFILFEHFFYFTLLYVVTSHYVHIFF